ncbi:MAG: RDD family protein, partial [Sphingomonas sp.]|nr:RDD family protein [Sphingomonas sp.]
MARPSAAPDSRRAFVTPEGIDLRLRLASASARAGAFMIDAAIVLGVLIGATLLLALLATGPQSGNL